MSESQHKFPSLALLFISFLRLGLTAFGGPAMVTYIKELSVKHNHWLDEDTFKDGIVICQTIPGATAMQTAAYVGFRVRGVKGALATYIGFGLPAFVIMLVLSFLYVRFHNLNQVTILFRGLAVIVVAIVANATFSFGRESVKNYREFLIAVLSAILFWTGMSPFLVIIVAGIIGMLLFMREKHGSHLALKEKANRKIYIQIGFLFVLLLFVLSVLFYADTKLFTLAGLMLKIDTFTFGGGFASLPLMLHEIVEVRGWMDNRTFMDGIALGQITPGPIVITATFVGFILSGVAGAVVATIAVFTPSFLILITVTPFFDRLKNSELFFKVAKGVLSSFVGLLFFVTIKFASVVSWDAVKVFVGLAALIALIRKVNILYVVLIGAGISLILL